MIMSQSFKGLHHVFVHDHVDYNLVKMHVGLHQDYRKSEKQIFKQLVFKIKYFSGKYFVHQ